MAKSNIYTRTGDAGQTSLVGGKRVKKNSARLEAYGTVDELNSFIGLLSSLTDNKDVVEALQRIQNHLFVIGSALATDTSETDLKPQSVVSEDMLAWIEHEIDETDGSLPPLRAFVLPGGTTASSVSHICRTVCRRAERCIISLTEETEIEPNLLRYMNRLSDYFFVLARKLNIIAKKDEIIWDKTCR